MTINQTYHGGRIDWVSKIGDGIQAKLFKVRFDLILEDLKAVCLLELWI